MEVGKNRQARRLVYTWEKDQIILFSFGPRGGIYK
jgi:hypothetical protein